MVPEILLMSSSDPQSINSIIKNKKDGKFYAMKVIALDKNEQKENTITSELKALYEINSPSIIHMYEAFFKDGCIDLIIEFMDCGSLEDISKISGTIPEPILSQMSEMMLVGLDYLEQHKIVHRDLKPANILVNSKGEVKIADFGMAGQKATEDQWTTFKGTFTYMSLERIKGQPHSFDSDIWSIGLTIATCALGKFPYELKENTIWEMMKYLETGKVIDHFPKEKFSSEFIEFITACMEFDPKKRPSAKSLLDYAWIKKYRGAKDVSIRHWLYDNYILVRKKQKELYEKKLKEQQELENQTK